MEKPEKISISTIERLSKYHNIIDELVENGLTHAYSHELSSLASVTSAQFRRDVASFGNLGNIAKGYNLTQLHDTIVHELGTDQPKNVALIGLGNLGKTMLMYRGFKQRGFEINVIFDRDPGKVDRLMAGRNCYHIDRLEEVLPQYNVQMVILATGVDGAQQLVNRLGNLGIKAILNFVPCHLFPTEGMFIEQVDISAKLEKLSFLLTKG